MTTYNLYRYRESGLCFVVTEGEESGFNAKYLDALTESLEDGSVEFVEVFDKKEELRAYLKENSLSLFDQSQLN